MDIGEDSWKQSIRKLNLGAVQRTELLKRRSSTIDAASNYTLKCKIRLLAYLTNILLRITPARLRCIKYQLINLTVECFF